MPTDPPVPAAHAIDVALAAPDADAPVVDAQPDDPRSHVPNGGRRARALADPMLATDPDDVTPCGGPFHGADPGPWDPPAQHEHDPTTTDD